MFLNREIRGFCYFECIKLSVQKSKENISVSERPDLQRKRKMFACQGLDVSKVLSFVGNTVYTIIYTYIIHYIIEV